VNIGMVDELEQKIVLWCMLIVGLIFISELVIVCITIPAVPTWAIYGWALYYCWNNYLRRDSEELDS